MNLDIKDILNPNNEQQETSETIKTQEVKATPEILKTQEVKEAPEILKTQEVKETPEIIEETSDKKNIDIEVKSKKKLKREQKEQKRKLKLEQRKNKKQKAIFPYIVALVLDFIVFGILVALLSLLPNIVLIELSSSVSRVFILNNITLIVIGNILLIAYFYFYPKDHNGATIMMRLLKVKVLSKEKPTIMSTLIYNIDFWIYFFVIDLGIVNQLNHISLNITAIVILFIQLVVIILLSGLKFTKVSIVKENYEN